jgi:mRNA-degrading endonuclease RelE of RelBE toxin-antitoxin system
MPQRCGLGGAGRLGVGDYRIIYKIEQPDLVTIVKIGHRREVYDD